MKLFFFSDNILHIQFLHSCIIIFNNKRGIVDTLSSPEILKGFYL